MSGDAYRRDSERPNHRTRGVFYFLSGEPWVRPQNYPALRCRMGSVRMGEMDLAIQEFLIESRENLDQLDRDLIAIEKSPDGREPLDSIFRTFHTIKGTCGFFDFPGLETVTHAGEGLLCDLREGRLSWSPAITG